MTPQQALEIIKNVLNATIKAGLFGSMEDVAAASQAYAKLEETINQPLPNSDYTTNVKEDKK